MKDSKFFFCLIICIAIQLCVSNANAVLCPHPSICPCTLDALIPTIDPSNPLDVNFNVQGSYNLINSIDFGDGVIVTGTSGSQFSHIYQNPGTYTVTISVECLYGCYSKTYLPDGSWLCNLGSEYGQAQTVVTIGQSPKHTIVATTGTGGIISPSGIVQVDDKTDQSFVVTPDQGYVIQDVVVDGISQGSISSYTFTKVVADHSIQATFINTHTIITFIEGGTIFPNGNIQVPDGQDQAFSITPDPGYTIINVIVDGVSQGAISSYTFKKVISDHSIDVVCRNGCDFSTSMERCFGGVGNGCNGDAPGAPFTYHQDTCTADGWMSAGSILHDRCCIETNNKGVMCSDPDGTDKCQVVWNEAVANTACSASGSGPRQWAVIFGPYPAGNLGDSTTINLRAPAGTRINPAYQYLCESGKCHKDKTGNTIKKMDGCGWYCECQGAAISKPFTISIKCPVEVSITDPDGLTINKQINQITGASYYELGLGSDGTPDAKIEIPKRKVGNYLITVTPKPGAAPTALFTLELYSDDSSPQNIVNNLPVNQIPSAPYKVQVTSDGDLMIISSSDIPVQEFPSTFLPVSMIIGFLGAVLFIQRTREH